MPRCAFLTLEDPAGHVIDDHLAHEPLRALGWSVDALPWRTPRVDWRAYGAVVIRSTWDYQYDPDAFLATLAAVEAAGTPLFNSLALVRWNLRKTYLRDLAARGVDVVPTVWRDRLGPGGLGGLLAEVGAPEVVVKPVVGASAGDTFRVHRDTAHAQAGAIEALFADRAVLAQPFIDAVTREGEFSLFWFDGAYSHAVLKTPKPGDFRVQEEHGGLIRAVRPDAALLTAGEQALGAIGDTPLYARTDFVRDVAGYRLMELELIEPSLYLRMDPGAPVRFAQAIDARAAQEKPW